MESKDGGSGERRVSSVRDEMEMSKEERDDFLRDHGAGVLSLAHGSESYAFPVSYGYDPSDELLCVMLGYAPESEKRGWLRETENATFVVHEMYDGLEAASVVLRGALVEVGDGRSGGVLRRYVGQRDLHGSPRVGRSSGEHRVRRLQARHRHVGRQEVRARHRGLLNRRRVPAQDCTCPRRRWHTR